MALGDNWTPGGCPLHGVPFGQACVVCTTSVCPQSYALPVNQAASGWQCPACRRVWSPLTGECLPCAPPVRLSLPSTYEAWPPTEILANSPPGDPLASDFPPPVTGDPEGPPRRPRCRYSPTPVGIHPEHVEGMTCKPSREGGMCGCDEPDDGPVLRLPAEMADPDYQRIAKVGREWAEIVPGLQACAPGPGLELGEWAVTALFRLTPPDGQDRD